MLDDVIKTVKAQLYDRATSPLSGAFILSWCGWNWKFLILLFSEMPVIQKYSYIETTLYPSYSVSFFNGLIYPLLTTIFVIFVYPIPARFVYGYWRNQQKKQKEIQQKIDDEEPLTNAEAREIKSSALQLELNFENERKQRESRIKELEILNKSLQDKLQEKIIPHIQNQLNNSISQNNLELDPADSEKLKILEQLAENNNLARRDLTEGLSTNDRVKVEHYIDTLVEGNFINETYQRDLDKEVISLRPNGRTAIVTRQFNIPPPF